MSRKSELDAVSTQTTKCSHVACRNSRQHHLLTAEPTLVPRQLLKVVNIYLRNKEGSFHLLVLSPNASNALARLNVGARNRTGVFHLENRDPTTWVIIRAPPPTSLCALSGSGLKKGAGTPTQMPASLPNQLSSCKAKCCPFKHWLPKL